MTQPTEHCGRPQVHPTHKAMRGRTVFQCPGSKPAEQPARHTVDSITSDELDQLYELLDRAERSAEQWEDEAHLRETNRAAAEQRAEQAEAELTSLRIESPWLRATTEDLVTAKAAITRVRKAILIVDDHDVTDWQRGYRACADRIRHALDEPQEQM